MVPGLLRLSGVVRVDTVEAVRRRAFPIFRHTGHIARDAYREKHASGFTPPGIEGVAGQPPNRLRQFWDVSLANNVPNRRCPFSNGFVEAMEVLAQELAAYAPRIFSSLEASLGPNGAGLEKVMAGGSHHLRATHYPKASPSDTILFPEHRDFSVVTVFVGGTEPGLQFKLDGQWQEVENPAGDVIIMAGTLLRFWSGGPDHPGRIKGVPHRIVNTGVERLSLSFFTEPHPDTPLPNSEGLTSGAYIAGLMDKIRAS